MNDILFGNNNKAVIKKLANRSFRSNKMRNVIAAIAIALTTFLFTAVLTIGMGAKGTLEYNMAKMIGTGADALVQGLSDCLLYTSPSPRDGLLSRMPSSA